MTGPYGVFNTLEEGVGVRAFNRKQYYELLTTTEEAFLYAGMTRLMLRRLAKPT